MSQLSFSDAEYAGKRKKTRREVFLDEIEQVVPWKVTLGLVAPQYPVAGRGRRPYPLASMLRVHLMQNWFALSDPAMEEALYEIASPRAFARRPISLRQLLAGGAQRPWHAAGGQASRPSGQPPAATRERRDRQTAAAAPAALRARECASPAGPSALGPPRTGRAGFPRSP